MKYWNTYRFQVILSTRGWSFGFARPKSHVATVYSWFLCLGPLEIRAWSARAREIRVRLEHQGRT